MTLRPQLTICQLTFPTPGLWRISVLRPYKHNPLDPPLAGQGSQRGETRGIGVNQKKGEEGEGERSHTGAHTITTSNTQVTTLSWPQPDHMWPHQPHETRRLFFPPRQPCPRLPRLSFHLRSMFTGPSEPWLKRFVSSRYIFLARREDWAVGSEAEDHFVTQPRRLIGDERGVAGRTRREGRKDYEGGRGRGHKGS